MITGTVKFFNSDKGYGFIQPEDGGNDAFVHISAVQAAGLHTLDRDQRVNYELETLAKDSPEWLARVRDFRSMIEEHMKMEENEVFPAFKRSLSDKQNAKLTAMMNKEGFRHA